MGQPIRLEPNLPRRVEWVELRAMKLPARWLLLLSISVLCTAACCAQAAAPNSGLPRKPNDLIRLAFQQNGLPATGLKPWHLHVTWQTVDAKGNVQETGTWEEWWAGKSEFKEVYEEPGFHQTYWATDHGDFVTGDQGWPAWIFAELESIYTPYHSAAEAGEKFEREWKKFGPAKLQCLNPHEREGQETTTSYCFDEVSPAIQVEIDSPIEVALYGSESFQGQMVPNSAHLVRLGLPDTIIQLNSIEELAQAPASLFRPPPDAVPVDPRRMQGMDGVVSARFPGERLIAPLEEQRRITIRGVIVALDIVVAKDGTVSRAEVVGATPELDLEPVLKAVKQAHCDPAMWHGLPIASRFTVETQLNYPR